MRASRITRTFLMRRMVSLVGRITRWRFTIRRWVLDVATLWRGEVAGSPRPILAFAIVRCIESAFAAEHVVVVLRESVSFVSHVLEQSQCKRVAAQPQGIFLAWEIDFLFAFCEGHKNRWRQIAIAKSGQCRIELAFAAVDHQ